MSAYDDLSTAITAKINTAHTAGDLSDEQKAEASIVLSQWIRALQAAATATATDVASYSIGGRSVSRRGSDGQLAIANSLRRQLNQLLYGICTEADFRTTSRSTSASEYTIG